MKPMLEMTTRLAAHAAPAPAKNNKTLRADFSENSRLVFGTQTPDLVAAEEYRIMARRLRARFPQGAVLAVSSPAQSEGKTMTASNLALAFGEDAQSTLLVDLDLRCPAIASRLSIHIDTPINNVLVGSALPHDAIREIEGRNVHVCTACVDSNPARAVSQDNLRPFIDQMRREYAYVILDTAPVYPAGDILEIAGVSDAVLLVVREGQTNTTMLQRSLERLSGRLCAVILNDSSLDDAAARYATRYHYGAQ